MTNTNKLIVVVGPTASGKSDLAVEIASHLNTEILSADSRQFYKEMSIGTAVPSIEQLHQVDHHFIQNRSVTQDYTAGAFEKDALEVISDIFTRSKYAVMVGGSGLYIDAVCRGFDQIPSVEPSIRQNLLERLETEGLSSLLHELEQLDIEYFKEVDKQNHKRVIRALEVILTTQKTYSSQRKGSIADRDFEIIKIGIDLPRELLYQRINSRVDIMIDSGLEPEAKNLTTLRSYNALQTVGYRELFDYFDGIISRDEAIELIKRNSRRYAKRQMTWFRKDQSIKWIDSSDKWQEILEKY